MMVISRRIQQLETQIITLEYRINSLDILSTESCLQQRLNNMARFLSFGKGKK